MRQINKNTTRIIIISLFVLVFSFFGLNTIGAVATAPTFVGSSSYSILGGAAITNTGASSATLDVGVSPGTSIDGGITTPGTHSNDASAIAAQADATTVYNNLSQTCDFGPVGPTDLAGAILTPGVHCYSSSVEISVGGVLHLDALGDPDAVWIFKIGSTLTTITGASVVFDNVGSACNVFWQVGSSATLGATTDFLGNIIAAHDITLVTGANVDGRIFARGVSADGTVALDTNTISGPTCTVPVVPATLNVIKNVITDNGGTAVAGDWNLEVTSSNSGTGTGNAVGDEAGTIYTLETDKQYSVIESGGPSGYLMTGSDDCAIASAVAGTDYTCTITNDDIAPTLVVNKIVVNDNTGVKIFSDFALFIGALGVNHGAVNTTTIGLHTVSETADSGYTSVIAGHCATDGTITLALGDIKICTITNDDVVPVVSSSSGGSSRRSIIPPLIDVLKVPSPLSLPLGPGPVTYTYTLRNIGTVPVTDITMVGDTCSPITLVSGDNNNNNKLEVDEIWIYSCTTILSATHTNIITTTGWANGINAVDIASATVVVGIPLVPPLIHVTKIPNPLALSAGGGLVTYTNKVTNPGIVPLINVSLTDDKCGPVKFISGDTNNDFKLDTNETWTYTCQSRLTKTTTNTVTAVGTANGLVVKDFAIATVVVSVVPGLPDTGFPPEVNNTPFILLSILIFSLIFHLHLSHKKQM